MSASWLENIPSSSPPAATRARSTVQDENEATPAAQPRRTQMLFMTPAQQARKSISPTPLGTSGLSPLDPSSIDPSLQMPSLSRQNTADALEPPPSTQRPSTGGKQPRAQVVTDIGEGSLDGSDEEGSSSSSDDEAPPSQRRRLAQTTGEKLGLSTKSISSAKQFAVMNSREQSIVLFCMMALIRDNQNDSSDSWTPSEDALDNIKAVVKATFLSPSLAEYKGDSVTAVVLAKSHTFGENPSNISELAEALLSKTNPRLADSFELWARLAVLRGTLLRHDHEKFWDELNEEMAAIRTRARDKYPGEAEGNERAQHIHKELKKALTNDYKQFGEPSLVREPPRRNTLKVSDFQAVVDKTAASKPAVEALDGKKRKRKGNKKKGASKK